MTTVTEIKEAKTKMEHTIRSAISSAMSEFRDTTGMSPSAIYVGLHEVTKLGESNHEYIVGEVSASLEL